MESRRHTIAGLLPLALVAAVAAGAVRADPQMSGFTIGPNPANTGDHTDGSPRRQFLSVAGFDTSGGQTVGPLSFVARYASTLDVDVSGFGNTESEGATSSFHIGFDIDALAAEAWTLRITSYRKGYLTIESDGPGSGYGDSQINSAVSATATVDGSPSTLANLQFPAVSETNQGNTTQDRNTLLTSFAGQAGTECLQGVGSSTAVLDFSWGQNVISHGAFATGGDEAAVRLGLSSTLSNFSAGEYRSGEDPALDGHFVKVEVGPGVEAVVDSKLGCNNYDVTPVLCTLFVSGHVEGFACDNYQVTVSFYRTNGSLLGTAVATNDGSEWTAAFSPYTSPNGTPGECPPYFKATASIEDLPGIVAGGSMSDAAWIQGGSNAPMPDGAGVSCVQIHEPQIPALGAEGRIAMAALLIGTGAVVLHARRRAAGRS